MCHRRMLLWSIFLGVLAISWADGYKTCKDCKKIDECTEAKNLVTNNDSQATEEILNSALCGSDGKGRIKVCCSYFTRSEIEGEGSFENHTNFRLLPKECGKIKTPSFYPWVVRLLYRSKDNPNNQTLAVRCSGTLISSRYVLTSASCLYNDNGESQIAVVRVCSDIDCDTNYQDFAVSNALPHHQFSGHLESVRNVRNDIGLLRLKIPVDFSSKNVSPVCLRISTKLREDNGIVSGWGTSLREDNGINKFIKPVAVYGPETCRLLLERYSWRISLDRETQLCVEGLGRDFCKGTAGSALMVEGSSDGTHRFVQYGILSYGLQGCPAGVPELYTDVRAFLKWILDTIEE